MKKEKERGGGVVRSGGGGKAAFLLKMGGQTVRNWLRLQGLKGRFKGRGGGGNEQIMGERPLVPV